jgi:hypothetical protein
MARWFAVAVLGVNAIDQMLFIPAYPLWSLMIIAVDAVALYGLCAYGIRANLEAAALYQSALTGPGPVGGAGAGAGDDDGCTA